MLQVHHPRADCRKRRLRDDEGVTEAAVETDRDVAGELDVLPLVVADGNLGRVVQQDVGDHQHRVVEEPDTDGLDAALTRFRGLVLELGHPPQFTEGCHAVEEPGQLGVGPDVALNEQQRSRPVEPGRDEHGGEPTRRLGELGRIPRLRHRVQVDDAEDGLVVAGLGRPGRRLGVDPPSHGAEVVAEMHLTAGFDPGKDPRHGRPR